METSSLGRPLEGLDPGGSSSAPGFPCRKVLALESCIHEAKVRGGHGHGQLRTSGASRGPTWAQLLPMSQQATASRYPPF